VNGTQRRAFHGKSIVNSSGAPKSTSQAEAILNNEKIKPIALAIVELRKSEGIRQAVRVSRNFH